MRILTGKHLSRRALLRGAGVAVALPWLESMLPAGRAFAQASSPVRLGFIYVPHGATMSRWTPAQTGRNFEFSEILQPLAPFREAINVISDLSHPMAYGPGGATAHHNRSSAVFLSGAMAQAGAEARLGITADQVAANAIGQETPLPSLELMINPGSLSCGDGLSCAYRNTISWRGESSPLPMEHNPQKVFERLFGDGSTDEQRQARRTQALSLLDAVGDELTRLHGTLPASDRTTLDRFFTEVREIERRIQRASASMPADVDIPARPPGIPDDIDEHIKLMLDLKVLAWQTDMTRVTTFQLAQELSNSVYPESGISESFHTLSHHSNLDENKAKFAVLNRYHVGLYAYLLEKLDAIAEPEGSLLDRSMVLYGSGMSDGNEHNHSPLPVVLAGHAGGALEGGRHLRFEPGTTMSNLLLAMLHKLEVEQESLGDSTDALTI